MEPSEFGHREHVQVAYAMLQKYGFLEGLSRYSRAIAAIATGAGAPEKFNVTITVAFLSLIAERIHGTRPASCDEFLADNPDLLTRNVLDGWYSGDQLHSEFARTHFQMPSPPISV